MKFTRRIKIDSYSRYHDILFSSMFKRLCLSAKSNLREEHYSHLNDTEYEAKMNVNFLTEAFIKGVLDEVHFEGIKINGKKYYELDNKWEGRNIKKHPYTHQEKELLCDEYTAGCALTGKILEIPYGSRWDFLIDYGKNPKGIEEKLFKNTTYLKLINMSGFNDDHRGSDHFMYKMPYSESVTLKNPTLGEFVDALYLIKSHKVDLWYELFCQAKININSFDEIDVDDQENKLEIKLIFDHGS